MNMDWGRITNRHARELLGYLPSIDKQMYMAANFSAMKSQMIQGCLALMYQCLNQNNGLGIVLSSVLN